MRDGWSGEERKAESRAQGWIKCEGLPSAASKNVSEFGDAPILPSTVESVEQSSAGVRTNAVAV